MHLLKGTSIDILNFAPPTSIISRERVPRYYKPTVCSRQRTGNEQEWSQLKIFGCSLSHAAIIPGRDFSLLHKLKHK